MADVVFVLEMSLWPPLWKRGVRGDFMVNRFIQKIPLNPPLPKGETARIYDLGRKPCWQI